MYITQPITLTIIIRSKRDNVNSNGSPKQCNQALTTWLIPEKTSQPRGGHHQPPHTLFAYLTNVQTKVYHFVLQSKLFWYLSTKLIFGIVNFLQISHRSLRFRSGTHVLKWFCNSLYDLKGVLPIIWKLVFWWSPKKAIWFEKLWLGGIHATRVFLTTFLTFLVHLSWFLI